MNSKHKKSALQGAILKAVISNKHKHNRDYSKKIPNTILSITDAIKQDKFSPREKEFLLFLLNNGKSLRKSVEEKCYKVAYAPSLLQTLNPKLKTHCNLQVKACRFDHTARKKWYLSPVKKERDNS